jgi:hypothetical protein
VFLEPKKITNAVIAFAAMLATASVSACYSESPPLAKAERGVLSSANNRVKFRGGKIYAGSLARALGLNPSEICKELGNIDCVVVHNIALGGVEPYEQVVYAPLPERSVSSVNAVDRIALSACDERAKKDFADAAKAVVFAELASAGAGRIDDNDKERVAKRLYQRILHRDARAAEVSEIKALYGTLEQKAGAETPRRFATLACYAIATTEEALFY